MNKKFIIGCVLGVVIGILFMFIALNTSTHSVTKLDNEIIEETYEYPDFRINIK